MKKINLIIKILAIIFIFQLVLCPIASRADRGSILEETIKQGSEFSSGGDIGQTNIDQKQIRENSNIIFNTLLGIGTAVAVMIGGILGIKFMMASAEGKAQIKEMLIPYIIGCAVIFGAFGIWKLIITVGQQITPISEGSSTYRIQEDKSNYGDNGQYEEYNSTSGEKFTGGGKDF